LKQKAFKTIKEFEDRIDRYFAECGAAGAYPDEAGMILYLGLEREAYDRYLGGEEGKGWAGCLKKARLRRESIIVRDLYASEKATTGKIFLARQVNNGGLSDKPREESQTMTIDVKISGGKNGGQFD
jgi:hypothetical protein